MLETQKILMKKAKIKGAGLPRQPQGRAKAAIINGSLIMKQ
jgi:hypothetical protein